MRKFMRISTDYPEYISYLYGRYPKLAMASYAEQDAALTREGFFWHGHWTSQFRAFGYKTWEVAWNNPHIQAAWARENGLPAANAATLSRSDLESLCLWQAKRYQPEVVWLHHWSLPFLQALRQEVPSIRLVFGWVGSSIPPSCMDFFRNVDLIFTCAPESLHHLSLVRDDVHLVPHWFSRQALEHLKVRDKRYDVAFIGGLRNGSTLHNIRISLLGDIASRCNLAVFSSEASGTPAVEAVRQPGIYGCAMLQAIRDSRIVLNVHADSSPLFASNLRLYEATGTGTCLLTDWRPNLPELFTPDVEIAAFSSPEECLRQIDHLLGNETGREAMARAGQARCLRDHSFESRLKLFDDIIDDKLKPTVFALPDPKQAATFDATMPDTTQQRPPLPAQLIQRQFESLRQSLHDDRFTPKRISCLDYDIGIVDGRSFVYQFKDIFVDQVYRFHAGADAPVIVDCGANVGLSCLYFKRLYPKAKIIAFEADRKIARCLEGNLARNGAADIRVWQKACWVHDAGVTFLSDGADGGHIDAGETQDAARHATRDAKAGDTIPSIRLRDILARMPRIHMLKMDIEGAETEVLPDCRDVLDHVEHLFFEFHSRLKITQRLGELLTLLQDAGFRYYIQDVGPRHSPFVNRNLHDGFDMQLNVFAYR